MVMKQEAIIRKMIVEVQLSKETSAAVLNEWLPPWRLLVKCERAKIWNLNGLRKNETEGDH
jgi:hypothetical protein